MSFANLLSLGRKRFFFEKKKQKTFGPAGAGNGRANVPRSKSFFASFFSKKEVLTYLSSIGRNSRFSGPV